MNWHLINKAYKYSFFADGAQNQLGNRTGNIHLFITDLK